MTVNPPATHLVKGKTRDGRTVYYTGAAGAGFVSPLRVDAFIGWYASGAERVAERLNRSSTLHGISFEPEAA